MQNCNKQRNIQIVLRVQLSDQGGLRGAVLLEWTCTWGEFWFLIALIFMHTTDTFNSSGACQRENKKYFVKSSILWNLCDISVDFRNYPICVTNCNTNTYVWMCISKAPNNFRSFQGHWWMVKGKHLPRAPRGNLNIHYSRLSYLTNLFVAF